MQDRPSVNRIDHLAEAFSRCGESVYGAPLRVVVRGALDESERFEPGEAIA